MVDEKTDRRCPKTRLNNDLRNVGTRLDFTDIYRGIVYIYIGGRECMYIGGREFHLSRQGDDTTIYLYRRKVPKAVHVLKDF